LEKNDRLVFTAKGSGLAAISQPVFRRVTEKIDKNLIFIICVDTLRSDHVGAYNPAVTFTPYIDRMAQDSLKFTYAYSTSSWTLPALVSFITGLTTFKHNVDYGNEVIRPDTPSLIETLSSKFVCYGLTGGAFTSSRYGMSRGFDYYQEKKNDGWTRNASHLLFKETTRILEKESSANILFFLHTYQVHDPYLPEKGLAKLFYQGENPGFGFNIVEFIKGRKELAKKVPEKKLRQIEQIYDAGIYTFDSRFGEFIRYLKEKNLYEQATIILFSDHGEEFLDHGCWVHTHTLYDELVKVPLLLKLPGNHKMGTKVEIPVSIMDILPTLLELHDLEYPETDIDGESLLKALGKSTSERILPMFLAPEMMHIPGKIALVKGWNKIIYSEELTEENLEFFVYPPEFEQYELYDLLKDPRERNNLFEIDLETSREMLNLLRNYKLKRGKPGYLPELEEQLKALGYIK
jgi:arylsulfatase A-like enzyme